MNYYWDPDKSIYENLCDIHGKKKMAFRLNSVYNSMKSYINNIIENDIQKENIYTINFDILSQTITDYFVDITRIKPFHNIDHTNLYKKTAYMAFWICRNKPIQIKSPIEKDTIIDTFINESFVTHYIAAALDYLLHGKKKSEFFMEELNYYLRYRPYNAQSIELMMLAYAINDNGSIPDEKTLKKPSEMVLDSESIEKLIELGITIDSK